MIAVFAIRAWGAAHVTAGDHALIEAEVRAAWTSDASATGAYSRFGWRHLGSGYFHVLAIPYRLLGSDANALSVGAMAVSTITLMAIVAIAFARGTAPGVAISLAAIGLIAGMGSDGVADPWNATIVLLPTMATIVACWAGWCGDARALVVAATAYGLVLHAHVGAAVFLTPVVLATAGAIVWGGRDRRRATFRRGHALALTAIALVGLGPILAEAALSPPGNVGRLARWAVTNDVPDTGWADAVRLLARTASLSFPLDPEQPRFLLVVTTDDLGVLPGVTVVALAILGVVGRRRGHRDEAALAVLVGVGWVTALLAARSVPEPTEWWLVEWLQPLGWLTLAAVALLAWRLTTARWPPTAAARHAVGAAAAVGAVGVGVIVLGPPAQPYPEVEMAVPGPVTVVADHLAATTDADADPVVIGAGDLSGESLLAGVVVELDRRGVDACVPSDLAHKFRPRFVCADAADLILVLRPSAAAGERDVVAWDSLDPATRARFDRAVAAVIAELRAAGEGELAGLVGTPFTDPAATRLPDGLRHLRDRLLWIDGVVERPARRYALVAAAER